MFTINSCLCDASYSINLENIDVDVMEFVFFKIRENRNNPSNTLTITFSEMKTGIGRYKKNDYIESLKRLDGVVVTTNQKSEELSKRYKFNFTIQKYDFIVGLDEKIFKLFHEPKSYNMYHQHYVYQFDEKYSKLFYKFIIRYKNLIGKSIFVKSNVLMKILNVHTQKSFAKIQYDIFYSCKDKINERTNLNISMDKECVSYENETKIVKYKVTINSYKKGENEMTGRDLKNKKFTKQKSEAEKRLDKWIDDRKSEFEFDAESKQIPFLTIEIEDELPLYIDDEYRLTNIHDYYTSTASETLDKLNELLSNGNSVKVIYNVGFPKTLSKACLLSQAELRSRGKI